MSHLCSAHGLFRANRRLHDVNCLKNWVSLPAATNNVTSSVFGVESEIKGDPDC